MQVYIQSAASHSACGFQDGHSELAFNSGKSTLVDLCNGEKRPFFAMANQAIEQSMERILQCLDAVVISAIAQSGLSAEQLANTLVILGSTSLDISAVKVDEGKDLKFSLADRLNKHLVDKFGLSDFQITISTACTASINALLYAKRLLVQGQAKHALVIGCEFFNQLSVEGFSCLELFSPSACVKTFDKNRDGLVLGEGVGALLLSTERPREGRFFEIIEGHSSCDLHSLTGTQEDGSHIAEVITQALSYANLNREDIDLIKVHGTATLANDLAEYNALKAVFPEPVPILALKPYIGHTLGACGVLEIALLQYLLSKDSLSTLSWEEGDTKLMSFVQTNKSLAEYPHILLNHSGFGGNNAVIILKSINT